MLSFPLISPRARRRASARSLARRLAALWLAASVFGSAPAEETDSTMRATASLRPGDYIVVVNAPPVVDPEHGRSRRAESLRAGLRLHPTRPASRSTDSTSQQAERPGFLLELDRREAWIDDAYLAPPPAPLTTASLQSIGLEVVDRWHGIDPDYAPPDLVAVEGGLEQDRVYELRREAAEAWLAMRAAADLAGVRLYLVSAYRPWGRQQELYERRVRLSGPAQATVAKPGHSEHQLGSAVDFSDGDEAHLLRESFGDTPAGRWLREHAWEYGFAVSYTAHNRAQTGYAPEPWHFRYWGLALARAKHLAALGEPPE